MYTFLLFSESFTSTRPMTANNTHTQSGYQEGPPVKRLLGKRETAIVTINATDMAEFSFDIII